MSQIDSLSVFKLFCQQVDNSCTLLRGRVKQQSNFADFQYVFATLEPILPTEALWDQLVYTRINWPDCSNAERANLLLQCQELATKAYEAKYGSLQLAC